MPYNILGCCAGAEPGERGVRGQPAVLRGHAAGTPAQRGRGQGAHARAREPRGGPRPRARPGQHEHSATISPQCCWHGVMSVCLRVRVGHRLVSGRARCPVRCKDALLAAGWPCQRQYMQTCQGSRDVLVRGKNVLGKGPRARVTTRGPVLAPTGGGRRRRRGRGRGPDRAHGAVAALHG